MISVWVANLFICLIVDVKIAAKTNINPCPIANAISINVEIIMLFDVAAKAIILANIGVEQGVPAIENMQPNKNGYMNMFPFFNCGISFIKTGMFISITFSIFKPIVNIIDAIIKLK